MTKFKLIFILSCYSFLFTGCKNNLRNKTDKSIYTPSSLDIVGNDSLDSLKFMTLNVNEQNISEININELIDEIVIINLETSNKCLIGAINKVCFSNDNIYLLDRNGAKAIFCFSNNGSFISKYDDFGKGPGEFSRLNDITTSKDKVFVLINNGQVLEFDIKLNLLSSFKTDFWTHKFEKINNGFVFCGISPEGELRLTDNQGKTKSSFIHGYNSKNMYSPYTFSVLTNTVLYHHPILDTIYLINQNSFRSVRHIEKKNEFYYCTYFESPNIILIKTSFKHHYYRSKKTNNEYNINFECNDPYYNLIYKRFYIYGIYNDYFITKLEPLKVIQSPIKNDKRIQDLKKDIDINSNPILILTRFKNL